MTSSYLQPIGHQQQDLYKEHIWKKRRRTHAMQDVSQDGSNFQKWAYHKDLTSDEELLKTAIKTYPLALRFAAPESQNNPILVELAVEAL